MGIFDTGDIDWGQILSGMPTPMLGAPTAAQSPAPDFNSRFGAAFPRSPISPENLAQNLAVRGVPPPPVDAAPADVGAALTGEQQPYRLAGPDAMDNWRTSVDVNNAGIGGTPAPRGVGGPAPAAPMNIQTPIQQTQVAEAAAPTDVSAKKKEGDTLLDALKGIKAPAGPALQHLGTPGAPRPTANIKGGQLLALLQSLNAGPQVAGDRNLPATLAAAIRRG